MSAEATRGFLQKIASDARYREKVERAIKEKPDQRNAILGLAAKEGFNFTAAELAQTLNASNGELNDGELGAVSGGFNPQPEPPRSFWGDLRGLFGKQGY
jgi:predicted ribosomally synthesized peptide with nif11-like leader